jgi:hypothetical protein
MYSVLRSQETLIEGMLEEDAPFVDDVKESESIHASFGSGSGRAEGSGLISILPLAYW